MAAKKEQNKLLSSKTMQFLISCVTRQLLVYSGILLIVVELHIKSEVGRCIEVHFSGHQQLV